MPDKTIAITGANGGLGRALAQRFAADGETVILLGRTLAKVQELADAIGDRATAIPCDVAAPDSVRAAFARIAEKFGTIDVLINNAGVFSPSPLESASDDLITTAVMTNLAGPAFCARAAIPLINRGGHIINVTSESVQLEIAHLVMYQAAKAGLERFSSSLHQELADQDKDIRVTVVRAGTMIGEGMSGGQMDPAALMAMMEASKKRGIDMFGRGFTQYSSTLDLFRLIIDAPADLWLGQVAFQARPVGSATS